MLTSATNTGGNQEQVVQILATRSRPQGLSRTYCISCTGHLGAGPALGRSIAGLASALHGLGELDEAAGLFGEALPLLRTVMGGSENAYVAEVLGEFVTLRLELDAQQADTVRGDQAETERLLREILAMRGGVIPPSHPTISAALHNLAPILAGRGEFEEAAKVASEALALERELFGDTHEWVAMSLCSLGRIAQLAANYPTARTHLEACADVLKRMYPEGHPQLGFPWSTLGSIAKAESGCAEAEPWFRRAYDIRREHLGVDHFLTKRTRELLEECVDR